MRLSAIETRFPFDSLFPVHPDILTNIKKDMAEQGYDLSQPIVIWDEQGVVVDGHTRLQAARELGLEDIQIYFKSFKDEDEALAYAIRNQRNRRNLTEPEILRCIEVLDGRKKAGRPPEKLAPNGANLEKGISALETAKLVGISARKVERARVVLDHAEETVKEAVRGGALSINRAYDLTQERRKIREIDKAVFNRNQDNIEWAAWTWDPVTGCRHDCPYCYARDLATPLPGENGFEPKFHPEQLSAPANSKGRRLGRPSVSAMSSFAPWPICSGTGCRRTGSTQCWRRCGPRPSGISFS
jgi:hypothetical protein